MSSFYPDISKFIVYCLYMLQLGIKLVFPMFLYTIDYIYHLHLDLVNHEEGEHLKKCTKSEIFWVWRIDWWLYYCFAVCTHYVHFGFRKKKKSCDF